MNTRHKEPSGPLSQERYMSSNEFAELRGISGVAVSARAAVLLNARKKELIWFIQGLSLAEGGLKRVAKDLVEMFPARIGTSQMHKAGIKAEKTYSGELVAGVEVVLDARSALLSDEPARQKKGSELIALCRNVALVPREKSMRDQYLSNWKPLQSLEEFLVDLCINPRIHFVEPGAETDISDIESEMAIEENPGLSKHDFKFANLVYFRDIIGALFEYKAHYEAKVRDNFQLTAIGNKIWQTLNFALASRGMVVLDGPEGRGKTEAVKAWYGTHLGTARFASLKGITSKTAAFREIAKALGIASSYARTATEMQARIEDVLKRSKLMLIVDEAHFLFNQSRRMYSRPELVDWIDTALCNCGLPLALITTDQFIVHMTRAADQVDWNYRQFRRRVKRWIKLPPKNTEEDIEAVARNVFKKADAGMISKIVGYALLSKRDLSAVGDVADEVRAMLGTDDLSKATMAHIKRAIDDFLLPSDEAFLEGMAEARGKEKKSKHKTAPALPELPEQESAAEEILPARARGNLGLPRSRAPAGNEASLIEA